MSHGRVAELVYAHDSKSCSFGIEGSIPSLPTRVQVYFGSLL